MYAEVELTDDILNFIKYIESHTETFEEIKELVFTKERLKANYNMCEIMNLTIQFQEIKRSAISKVLKKQKLNFPEGIVFERMLKKYSNNITNSVEEHISNIKSNCVEVKRTNNLLNRISSKLLKNEIQD